MEVWHYNMKTIAELINGLNDVPDDQFPDFIFKPMAHDYGEDDMRYFMDFDESDPRLKFIRTNKKKERDVFRYIDKMEIYTSYMRDLIDKYGSLSLVIEGSRQGLIPEYVPVEPKLKLNRYNKMIMRSGRLPSRSHYNEDQMKNALQLALDLMNSEKDYSAIAKSISEDQSMDDVSENIMNQFKESAQKQDMSSRRNMFILGNRTSDMISGFDMAYEYYTSRNQFLEKKFDDSNIDYMELLREAEDLEATPDFILADKEKADGRITWVNGVVMYKSDANRKQLIQDMIDGGFNPFEILGKDTMRKDEIKLFNGTASGTMDEMRDIKKQSKRIKKQQKKQMASIANVSRRNTSIAALLTANRYDVGADYSDPTMMNYVYRNGKK